MKKIAILNDIHGNLYLLNKVLTYLQNQNIDYYFVCGDFLTDGPDSNQIITTLQNYPTFFIKGNREETIIAIDNNELLINAKSYPIKYTHDTLTQKNLNFIKKLSTYFILNIENKKICISHGSPDNLSECVTLDEKRLEKISHDYPADIYFFAHTHTAFVKELNHKLFINSGAINRSYNTPSQTLFGILSIDSSSTNYEQIFLDYDYQEVEKYYLASPYYQKFPEWSNIILYTLKTGKNYLTKFSQSYDYNQDLQVNFQNFMNKNNLTIIKA